MITRSKLGTAFLAAATLGLCQLASAGVAGAAPIMAAPADPQPLVRQAQIFQRGRPPIYPYYYAPPRGPNGWGFYFGPVPYHKGDYETQALQRAYPQMNYPPSMRAWTPQSGF